MLNGYIAKGIQMTKKRKDKLGKIFLIYSALLIIFYSIVSLMKEEYYYSNYWGGVVFAPIGIVVGLLVLYIVLFKWKEVEKNENAFNKNSKMDDYQKW